MGEFLEVPNDAPDDAGGQEQPDHRGNGYRHRAEMELCRAEKEPCGFDRHLIGRGLHTGSRPCCLRSVIHSKAGSSDPIDGLLSQPIG